MDKTIKVRQYAASVCDLFEELLDKHNITIPDDDRTGANGEGRLYGLTYFDLELEVTEVLHRLVDEVKANPETKCEYFDY